MGISAKRRAIRLSAVVRVRWFYMRCRACGLYDPPEMELTGLTGTRTALVERECVEPLA
jgi:hypothetical protein